MEIINLKLGELETNCYILKSNGQCLIIDPAAEVEKIKEEIKGLEVKGILITHYHYDHIGELDEFADYSIYDFNNEEKEYKVGNFNFDILKTPGHKEDCVSFLFEEDLFVGDFIFKGTIGRTDLEGGNFSEMQSSLNRLKKMKKDIKIYPGHGPITSLMVELKTNPYMI